jgi:hypothetical protein
MPQKQYTCIIGNKRPITKHSVQHNSEPTYYHVTAMICVVTNLSVIRSLLLLLWQATVAGTTLSGTLS